MKKGIALTVTVVGIGVGVVLAGGVDNAWERGRSALAALTSEAPAPSPPIETTGAPPVAPPRTGASEAPTPARIERRLDEKPREHITDEDRARLEQIIGERLDP